MRVGILALLGAVLLLTSCGQGPRPREPQVLQAGKSVEVNQRLDVNVVFIGFEEGEGAQQVNLETFRADLPSSYRTINRIPSIWYVGSPEYTGNNFEYDYNLTFADASFTDGFFTYLASIAEPQPPTLFQFFYNCQYIPDEDNPPCEVPAENISNPITDNHWIDGPSVERWLVENAGGIGIDPSQYTVFFINWYGREDFKFHVYTKTDEPDPDTGYNFGIERDSRKIIAWGGTPEERLGRLGRVWFVDLSAGPESWTGNWDITNPVPGVSDAFGFQYRMPPIWEYGNTNPTYRPFDTLSIDLAKITRFVAVNLLFTPSPLYRVALTPPLMPDEIQLDMLVHQGDPTSDGKDVLDANLILANLSPLQPFTTFSAEVRDVAFAGEAEAAYRCTTAFVPCTPPSIISSWGGDLFLYGYERLGEVLAGDAEYELPIYTFNVPDDDELVPPALGWADDDWKTGTQSMVFAFDSPFLREIAGYGFTTTIIHEVGHHLGLSHPHDGYDSELGIDYGPGGPFTFAWLGTQSHGIMSYIDLTWEFGQFNLDSMNRYLVTTYLNQATEVLGQVEEADASAEIRDAVLAADDTAQQALAAYAAMDYPDAASLAYAAYTAVVEAAEGAGVSLEPFHWYEDFEPFSLPSQALSGNIHLEHHFPIQDGPEALEKRLQP